MNIEGRAIIACRETLRGLRIDQHQAKIAEILGVSGCKNCPPRNHDAPNLSVVVADISTFGGSIRHYLCSILSCLRVKRENAAIDCQLSQSRLGESRYHGVCVCVADQSIFPILISASHIPPKTMARESAWYR